MAVLLMSKTTEDTRIEKEFFLSCGGVPSSLAYVPSKTDSQRAYYNSIKNHYESMGVNEVLYCDFDAEFKASVFDKISACDAIYLAGGLTPYFLQILKKRNAFDLIREFARTKMVIGVSAGALILGPDISILSDDPGEGYFIRVIADDAGVGLFDFDFWPHYGRHESDEKRFVQRSLKKNRKVIGCDDHSAVMMADGKIEIIGSATVFDHGHKKIMADRETWSF